LDPATGAIDKEITMTGKLAGKITVVTGGSAGIAKRFAQEGARVFIIGRRQAQLEPLIRGPCVNSNN
jgi:NADP-dependent 3-hydroxy acid dehydrogenase YdfG